MRGLRLFIRPVEASDATGIRAFMEKNAAAGDAPACGLLGKLLGDIVAVVSLELIEGAVVVSNVLVARELRRKWIGRSMLREVEQLASKMDRHRVVVEDAGDADEFFRRTGFDREGEKRWVKVVP